MEIHGKKAGNVRLNGKKIVPEAVYHVATSNYLASGADHFTPLTKALDTYDSGLLIRDLYMKHVIQHPQVTSSIDGRMKIK